MRWNEIFDLSSIPSEADIRAYLGEAGPIWDALASYIKEAYQVKPKSVYSKCSMQPGWNVKYKKSGKALCTLYPMAGWFFALIVVGPKEEEEVKAALNAGLFTSYTKELYERAAASTMGRWLMIEVKDVALLNDITHLMAIRMRPKKIST